MWALLLPLLLDASKDPRARRGAAWLLLGLLLIGGLSTVAIAVPIIHGGVLTLGFIGGVASAWFRAYNGSVYYTIEAIRELGAIARAVRSGQDALAKKMFDAWLASRDPLGLVRAAIDEGRIENDPTLFQEVPK